MWAGDRHPPAYAKVERGKCTLPLLVFTTTFTRNALDGHTVESAWGAVPALLLVRLPKPLAEPGV